MYVEVERDKTFKRGHFGILCNRAGVSKVKI